MKKWMKIGLFLFMSALMLQAGMSAFANVNGTDADVQDQSQAYRQFIADYGVVDPLRDEVDRLVAEGNKLSDVMIGYAYIYHQFGKMDQLEKLLIQRKQGTAWSELFASYRSSHSGFEPRAFEPDYLEKLSSTAGFTSDDIMIADMVSFVSDKPIEDVVEHRLESGDWRQIAAEEGILYTAGTLPRVPITAEQLQRYQRSSGLTEDQIVSAFVLANKLRAPVEAVINEFAAGVSEEAIYADILSAQYEG